MPRLNDLELVEPASADDFRQWLDENADTSPGAWVAIGKKGGKLTTLTYDQAVEEALCFGWIDSTVNRMDEHRFKQLFTPRKPTSQWSKPNKERVARLTAEGRMRPAGLAAVERAKENGSWTALDHVDSLEMPEDLAAALAEQDGATAGFEQLTASQQRTAFWWIASAKRPETRAGRIEKTVKAASQGRPPY